MKHTPTQRELYEKERELLREKLEAWLRGDYHESRSAWIGMRVTPTIRELYSRAPVKVKLAARRAFESVIISWFLGSGQVSYQRDGAPQVFNINLSIVEAKAEAKAETRLELPKQLLDDLARLQEFLGWLAYQSDPKRYPAVVRQKAAVGLEALRGLLKRIQLQN